MFYVILIGSFCLYLLLYHTGWVILAGLIVGGVYLIRNFDLVPAVSKDREAELSQEKKEYPTAEEVYAKEVDSLLKPGFKDDPKWQELNKKVRKHNAHQDELARQESYLEELTNEVI